MAVTGAPETTAPTGPAQRRAPGGALSLGKRFLTLREGSIIVVTLITAIYFAATGLVRFLTVDSFKTLLPYFAPYAILAAGEVFVMINGRDRPVDRRDVPVHAVLVLQAAPLGVAAVPSADPGDDHGDGAGRGQRDRHRLHRDLVVRGDAGHVVRARRGDAGDVACHAGHASGHGDLRQHDVRQDLRWWHLLGADLGGGDRDPPPVGAEVHPLGHLHRVGGRKPARRGRGRRQREAGADPQLHDVRAAGRVRRDPRDGSRPRRSPRIRRDRTSTCSRRSPPP